MFYGIKGAGASAVSNFIEQSIRSQAISYFFGYKKGDIPFQNNLKDLDPSYKMDLDL